MKIIERQRLLFFHIQDWKVDAPEVLGKFELYAEKLEKSEYPHDIVRDICLLFRIASVRFVNNGYALAVFNRVLRSLMADLIRCESTALECLFIPFEEVLNRYEQDIRRLLDQSKTILSATQLENVHHLNDVIDVILPYNQEIRQLVARFGKLCVPDIVNASGIPLPSASDLKGKTARGRKYKNSNTGRNRIS